ncbi:MAG TPA: hypothetical protein VGM77_12380 [Gemmatimonadales bacterium]|jgi:hypothetical protein
MRPTAAILILAAALAACSDQMGPPPSNDLGPAVHGLIASIDSTRIFVDGSNGLKTPGACSLSGWFNVGQATQVLKGSHASSSGQLAVGQTVDAYPIGLEEVSCPVQANAGRIVILP